MSTDIVTLSPDDTVTKALEMMRDHQAHNIPVVDKDGGFIGLFSLRRLTHALLPKAAQLDQHRLMMDIDFIPDEPEQLVERLRMIGSQPVSGLLEKKGKLRFCEPDTPLPQLLKRLYENPISLPVVVLKDKKKKLVGIVSNWDVLTKVALNILSSRDAGSRDEKETMRQSALPEDGDD